ncbi:MAG: O-antigen ligase family protein [Erythrobacter sp.]
MNPYANHPQQASSFPLDRLDRSMSARIGVYSLLVATFGFWFAWGIGPGAFTISVTQIFTIIAFCTCVFQWMVFGITIPLSTRALLHPFIWVSVAMILVGFGSMVSAPDPILTVRFISRWVFGILYLIAIVQLITLDAQRLKMVIRAFLYGGVATVPALVAGYFYRPLGELVFWDLWSYRSNGFLEHPNQLAMVTLVGLVLAQLPGLLTRRLWLVVVAALLFVLVTAGSKINIALAILIIPVIFFWLPAREGRAVEAVGGALAGLIAALATLAGIIYGLKTYNNYYYRKLEQFITNPDRADSTQSRGGMWQESIDCMLEKPVFGIGGGNANACIDYTHAHNVFINYLLETGVVGFLTFVAFLLLVISPAVGISKKLAYGIHASAYNRQLFRSAGLVLVAMVLFITANMSSDSLGGTTMPVLWLLAGIPLAMNTIVERKRAQPRSLPGLGNAATPNGIMSRRHQAYPAPRAGFGKPLSGST